MELFAKAPEAYILEFVKKMAPLVRDALSTLLSSRNGSDPVRVAGLVLDFLCVPLIDVGNEFNLPSHVFLTFSARFLGLMKYLPERHRRVKSELHWSSGEEENTIPGFASSVPTRVLPPGLFNGERYEGWVELADKYPQAKGILWVRFSAPTILRGIMRWLDEQAESSVVFLCFGSMKNLSVSQIKEIAQALEIVGCRFLWSIRTDPKDDSYEILPDGFMNRVVGQGLVCGWAPQVEILAHKAIKGFVSHCGWNSILESLRFGVPIVTWPLSAEQQLNAFTMVTELGLALEMRLDYVLAHGEIVKADEIAKAVLSLMDGEDVPRRKLKEIAEAAKEAAMDDGSSFVAVKRFIEKLLSVMDYSNSRENVVH
ncbi:unnamed protein product [Microthlaspi erraticum]|uniref:Uncharacterized protein n=1 Tax=Microthlaspi erraticum TaxID=1685480 RepID=A0A6D2JE48_9BRAS|nr:unnamed protein product [Microthlaspi erraticum]